MKKSISAKQTREILKTQWPELKYIWGFDKRFTLFSSAEIENILKEVTEIINEVSEKYFGKKMIFSDEKFDCDDFALVTNAFVKLQIAAMELLHNGAIGEVSMIYPTKVIHNQNIFITDDLKVKLYEPQAAKIIEPGQGESIFYVRM